MPQRCCLRRAIDGAGDIAWNEHRPPLAIGRYGRFARGMAPSNLVGERCHSRAGHAQSTGTVLASGQSGKSSGETNDPTRSTIGRRLSCRSEMEGDGCADAGHARGSSFRVCHVGDGQTRLRCWYVDLQEPLRRTVVGFDTMDNLLDIVISPDLSEWQWKDEDEFQEAVAIGVYSAEEARAIRAEGERAIELLRAGQPPFCDGWDKWSPPVEWQIPQLPDGWDKEDTDEVGPRCL